MARKQLHCITDLKKLRGKKVIVRTSFNVPVEDGHITNYFRIMRAIPTLKYLQHEKAKVILISHIGRDPGETLRPIFEELKNHVPLSFIPGIIGNDVDDAIAGMEDGSFIMLENLRSHEGEVTNDASFAKTLASYAEYYVNDAFSVSHREHASIIGVPEHIPSTFGLTFKEEYVQLGCAMKPSLPALFILGGAKFETKQPLVERYLKTYDHVFIGGALANDFFKAKGYETGRSLVSGTPSNMEVLLKNKKILLPVDVTVQGPKNVRVTTPDDVNPDENILDAGPLTHDLLKSYIADTKTILWNGPLGDYEHGFDTCTKSCAKLIAESDAHSVVGGGDTVAAIESLALRCF